MQGIISLNLDAATISRLRELGYVDPETRDPLSVRDGVHAALSEASGVDTAALDRVEARPRPAPGRLRHSLVAAHSGGM